MSAKKIEKNSDSKIYLRQYIEAILPQALGSSSNASVGIISFWELNGSESVEINDFLILTLAGHQHHKSNCIVELATKRYIDKPSHI